MTANLAEFDILLDYCEYTQKNPQDIFHKLTQIKPVVAEEFKETGLLLYNKSENYLLEVMSGNVATKHREELIEKFLPALNYIMRYKNPKSFADFGAGIGVVCDIFEKKYKIDNIYHIDVDGPLYNFANWRAKKYGKQRQYRVIPLEDFSLPESYDIIYTDAVWEHLKPDQQLSYASKLASYVNNNGLLIFLVDLSGHTNEMPMHFDVNIVEVHNKLTQSGLKCLVGQNTFASIWER